MLHSFIYCCVNCILKLDLAGSYDNLYFISCLFGVILASILIVVVNIARGSMTDPSDTQIFTVPLHLLASSCGEETKPSLVLASRLNRLPTFTCWRSSGFSNMLPQIPYLLQAKTGQSHTMCTLSSFIVSTQPAFLLSVCQSFVQMRPQGCVDC